MNALRIGIFIYNTLSPPGRGGSAPAVAASFYLVPALHAAAQWRDALAFGARLEPTWQRRLTDAAADYEQWRTEQDDSGGLPDWPQLARRVFRVVGDTRIPTVPGGYIAPADQEDLLQISADGVLPIGLLPLQRWASSRLGFPSAADEAAADGPAARPDRRRCPDCDAAIAEDTTDGVTCAGPCAQRWHRGCVLASTRDMPSRQAWAPHDGRRLWRCVACGTAAVESAQSVALPSPRPRTRYRVRQPPQPTRTTAEHQSNSGDAEPPASCALPLALPLPRTPRRGGAAAATSLPATTFDAAALQAALSGMSASTAWDWVVACREAQPGPPRRFLPGGVSRSGPPLSRRVAVAVAAVTLQAAADGSAAAQIVSLYLPRIFYRRGVEITTQVADFVAGRRPPAMTTTRTAPDAATRLRQWCARLARAHHAGDIRSARRILECGPDDTAWPEETKDRWLRELFPQPDANSEVPREDDGSGGEATTWHDAAHGLTNAAPWPLLIARDIVGWARARRAKAADLGGWSGQIILDLCATDLQAGIATLLARLWGMPPAGWKDDRARATAFRSATGILQREPEKDKPRPIAAPSVARRIASAVDARRARKLANAFCSARGQVGLADGGPLAAYSVFPRLVVQLGGTTCSADNTSSFQTFTRRGLLSGLTTALASAEAQREPEAATALARLMTHYVMDSAHALPRTMTAFACGRVATSHALAQGCSSSPTAEAIVLASAPDRPLQPPGSIRKAAHDDSQASILGDDVPLDGLAPPPPWGGSVYNTLKSVAVGPRAADAVERGYAASAATYASVFGAPVGDIAAWAREVWLPRWQRTCASIKKVAAESPDTAVLAAHLLRGPGVAASHWLRLAPCHDAATRRVLAEADSGWVDLWLELAGYSGAHRAALPRERVEQCVDRLFGDGPDCFRHLAASDIADARFWAGMADAWPTVAEWTAELRSPLATPATMAIAMGVPADVAEHASRGCERGVAIVREWLRQRAHLEGERLIARRAARRSRMAAAQAAGCGHGAYASPTAVMNGHPNLLIAALGDSAWPLAGALSADGAGAPIILARIFGLPLWPALGVPPPSQCRRCQAPALQCPCEGSSAPSAASDAGVRRGLRATIDCHGDHLTACRRGGPPAGAKWRHDSFTRDMAAISNAVGCGGHVHDGIAFSFGRKLRPADMKEDGDLCIDFTIGDRNVLPVGPREAAKIAKYADQLRIHPGLRFQPFAIDLDGEVGPGAAAKIAGWGRALAEVRRRARVPAGDPSLDVRVAVGRAFTRGYVAQAVAWLGQTRGTA